MTKKAKRNPYKLKWLQASTLYASLGVLFLTGIFLGWKERLEQETVVWLLQLHGYSVPLFLVSFGSILAKHSATAWKGNKNRVSGAVMIGTCLTLILTGVFLYYVGSESIREGSRLVHLWTGLFLIALIPWHVIAGLLTRKKSAVKHKSHA